MNINITNIKNQIGLESGYANQMAEKMNNLLNNIQFFYMNTRRPHRNITGRHFFKWYEKSGEWYDDLNDKADEVAGRILMLEGKPVHAFSDYLKIADIQEITNVSSGQANIKKVLDALLVLLA